MVPVLAPDADGHGHAQGLKRTLRLRDVALLYIATTLSVRWVATAAAAGPGSLMVWFFALVGFFVPLAASVMELSSRYPQEGGLYIWAREAFGDFAGFLSGVDVLDVKPAVLCVDSCISARGRRCLRRASGDIGWPAVPVLHDVCGGVAGGDHGGEHRGAERGEVAEQHRIDGEWLSVLVLVALAAVARGAVWGGDEVFVGCDDAAFDG